MVSVSRSSLLSMGVTVATCACIFHAYYHKQQFYPTVVYLTKSNASLAVLYIQALVFVMMIGRLLASLFFGQLRAAESEHLVERGWYTVTETCLAFTVFRDDFSSKFVAQFTLLLFIKVFHWLAEDRVDYMERSPVISLLFHVRMMTLMGVLTMLDSYFYAILMTIVFHVAIKYLLHTTDLRNAHPWEQKAGYLLYTELVIDLLRCLLYCAFIGVMLRLHTFPLYSIRPFYLTVKALKKAVQDVIMSRRAIHAMNHLFPNVTQNELDTGDNVCIICREEMHSTVTCKRLPCSHMFHVQCLRSWFQRQQTCPTCRRDILTAVSPPRPTVPVQPAAAAQPGQQPQTPPQPPAGPQPTTSTPLSASTQPPANFFSPNGSQSMNGPIMSPIFNPASMMVPPGGGLFLPSMPLPPTNAALSDEEVRQMEGTERRHVEARIQYLRNMQVLLDCAAVQMQQYTSVLAALASTPEFRANASTLMTPPQQQQPSSTTADQPTSSVFNESSQPATEEEIRQRRLHYLAKQSTSSNAEQQMQE